MYNSKHRTFHHQPYPDQQTIDNMSLEEERQTPNGKIPIKTNGTIISNGTKNMVPSQQQQNGQRQRNSTTVPPMIHHNALLNNPNEHIVYRLVLTGGKLTNFLN